MDRCGSRRYVPSQCHPFASTVTFGSCVNPVRPGTPFREEGAQPRCSRRHDDHRLDGRSCSWCSRRVGEHWRPAVEVIEGIGRKYECRACRAEARYVGVRTLQNLPATCRGVTSQRLGRHVREGGGSILVNGPRIAMIQLARRAQDGLVATRRVGMHSGSSDSIGAAVRAQVRMPFESHRAPSYRAQYELRLALGRVPSASLESAVAQDVPLGRGRCERGISADTARAYGRHGGATVRDALRRCWRVVAAQTVRKSEQ